MTENLLKEIGISIKSTTKNILKRNIPEVTIGHILSGLIKLRKQKRELNFLRKALNIKNKGRSVARCY